MVVKTRLLFHKEYPPYLNMGIDEALFTLFQPDSSNILRIYTWKKEAHTIGRLQYINTIKSLLTYDTVVRRITGGGVVSHGNDLTFSLICNPALFPLMGNTKNSYFFIHNAIATGLSKIGIKPVIHQSNKPEDYSDCACFNTPVKHDLLSNNTKIAGGAQHRKKNKFIHQGSLQNIFESVSIERVRDTLAYGFKEKMNLSFISDELSSEETALAEIFLTEKYSQDSWNYRR
ncbi:biotin/lipoate A/B protein ligase family protein [Chlamydiota bacterium]